MDVSDTFYGNSVFKQLFDLAVCKLCLQGLDLSCLRFELFCNRLCFCNDLCLTCCFKFGSNCTDYAFCVVQQFQYALYR